MALYCLIDQQNVPAPHTVLCHEHYNSSNVEFIKKLAGPGVQVEQFYDCTPYNLPCTMCVRQAIQNDAFESCAEQLDLYGAPEEYEVPDNVRLKLGEIMRAPNERAAREIGARAVKKMEMHCLHLWAQKKVTGPDNPLTLENRAKRAEKEAKKYESLIKDGKEELIDQRKELAAKWWTKAKELKERALMLRGLHTTPTETKTDGGEE